MPRTGGRRKAAASARAVAVALMMLTRKPAMYALCLRRCFCCSAIPAFGRGWRARCWSAAAVFAVLYNRLLLPALGVIPGETREMLSVPFQQTARCLLALSRRRDGIGLRAVSAVLDVENGVPNYDPPAGRRREGHEQPRSFRQARPVYAGVAEHGDAPPPASIWTHG